MDTARYVVALIALVTFVPAIGFWVPGHGLVHRWRRLGPAISYSALTLVMVVLGTAVYLIRKPLLTTEFGTNWWLIALAAISYAIALAITVKCRKQLSMKIQVGLPEFHAAPQNQKLLQEGIYSRIRHPRYIAMMFGLLAAALFANYLTLYIFVPVCGLGLYLVTVLEERELLERFGDQYATYRARVPRFLPKLRPERPRPSSPER